MAILVSGLVAVAVYSAGYTHLEVDTGPEPRGATPFDHPDS